MSESIQSILDNVLAEEALASTREPVVSPSCLGDCIRKLIMLERKYVSAPFEAMALRTFRAGYLFEAFVLDILEKRKLLIKRQELVEYRGIKGTLDSVIHMNGENILFDVKSIKMSSFQYLDREGASEKYIYQLSFYHKALALKLKISNTARIFFVEKENLLLKEVPVVCPNHYEKIDKKIDIIEAARKERELPAERNLAEGTFPCFSANKKYKSCKSYCQYIQYCPNTLLAYKNQRAEFGLKG